MANAAPTSVPSATRHSHEAPARAASGGWSDCAVDVLELLSEGVLVLDTDCRVRGMNKAARAFLGQRGGLSIGPLGLRGGSVAVTQELGRRVRAVARGAVDAEPLRIARPGQPPLMVRVSSIPSTNGRRAAVVVTEAATGAPPSAEQIIDHFGATPTESEVAHRLASGACVESISHALGIAAETVRAHLKRLYVKTGTHRQSQLVALLLNATPGTVLNATPGVASTRRTQR